VTAVHKDGEAYRRRPAEFQERVHRRPCRPSGVEHVVHEHYRLSGYVEWYAALAYPWLFVSRVPVVPVQRDVQRPYGDLQTLEVLDIPRDPVRQRHPAGKHADQRKVVEGGGVAFEDLVRDPPQRAVYAVFGEYFGESRAFGGDAVRMAMPTSAGDRSYQAATSFAPHGTPLKGYSVWIKLPEGESFVKQ
jgi:hypothetical protein